MDRTLLCTDLLSISTDREANKLIWKNPLNEFGDLCENEMRRQLHPNRRERQWCRFSKKFRSPLRLRTARTRTTNSQHSPNFLISRLRIPWDLATSDGSRQSSPNLEFYCEPFRWHQSHLRPDWSFTRSWSQACKTAAKNRIQTG